MELFEDQDVVEITCFPRVIDPYSMRIKGLSRGKRETCLNKIIDALRLNSDNLSSKDPQRKYLTRPDFQRIAVDLESQMFNQCVEMQSYLKEVISKETAIKKSTELVSELKQCVKDKQKIKTKVPKSKLINVMGNVVRVHIDDEVGTTRQTNGKGSSSTSTTPTTKSANTSKQSKSMQIHGLEFTDRIVQSGFGPLRNPTSKDPDEDDVICIDDDDEVIEVLPNTAAADPKMAKKRRGSESMLESSELHSDGEGTEHKLFKVEKVEPAFPVPDIQYLKPIPMKVEFKKEEPKEEPSESQWNLEDLEWPMPMKMDVDKLDPDETDVKSEAESQNNNESGDDGDPEPECNEPRRDEPAPRSPENEPEPLSSETVPLELQPIVTRTLDIGTESEAGNEKKVDDNIRIVDNAEADTTTEEGPQNEGGESKSAQTQPDLNMEQRIQGGNTAAVVDPQLLPRIKQEPSTSDPDPQPQVPKKSAVELVEEKAAFVGTIVEVLTPYLKSGAISREKYKHYLKKLCTFCDKQGLKDKKAIEDFVNSEFSRKGKGLESR